jgi:enamine deaminase RidA (YjgF/YER057c/UK114 family)
MKYSNAAWITQWHVIGAIAGVTGCKKKEGQVERTGKEMYKAAEKTGQQIDKAIEKTGEKIEEAGDIVKSLVK